MDPAEPTLTSNLHRPRKHSNTAAEPEVKARHLAVISPDVAVLRSKAIKLGDVMIKKMFTV